jgi:hypothetical protein
MIRKLVLGLTILAIATLPLPAWAAWDGGRGGGHETRGNHQRFGGHERFERGPAIRFGFYPSTYYAYAPPACAWQPGYPVTVGTQACIIPVPIGGGGRHHHHRHDR